MLLGVPKKLGSSSGTINLEAMDYILIYNILTFY